MSKVAGARAKQGNARVNSKVHCGAPPKVVLILPPCVAVAEKAAVHVHVDWGARSLGAVECELVGAAQGAQVFSKIISKEDGEIVRVEWTPAELGVVDVFVLGSNSNDEVSVGELGHLLVLPDVVCKEANAIFSKLVASAGTNRQEGSPNISTQLERAIVVLLQNWDTTAFRCLENSAGPEFGLRSFPGLRRVDEYVRNAVGAHSGTVPLGKPVTDGKAGKIESPLRASEGKTVCCLEKHVWRTDFRTLVLDLDVLFQLLDARRARMYEHLGQQPMVTGAGRPADLDIAIKLILGNVLRHLRRFEAWDFIAHVLQRCADFDVEVFWGDKELQKHALTGAKLQEMARRNDEHRQRDCDSTKGEV